MFFFISFIRTKKPKHKERNAYNAKKNQNFHKESIAFWVKKAIPANYALPFITFYLLFTLN